MKYFSANMRKKVNWSTINDNQTVKYANRFPITRAECWYISILKGLWVPSITLHGNGARVPGTFRLSWKKNLHKTTIEQKSESRVHISRDLTLQTQKKCVFSKFLSLLNFRFSIILSQFFAIMYTNRTQSFHFYHFCSGWVHLKIVHCCP